MSPVANDVRRLGKGRYLRHQSALAMDADGAEE